MMIEIIGGLLGIGAIVFIGAMTIYGLRRVRQVLAY
jgi:hypothetical protein